MRTRMMLALLVMVVAVDGPAWGQGPRATGKPWVDMEYGPYLTTTVESPVPAGNFAYKGVTIHLDGKRSVVFDTDTLRYSAGWVGDFLQLKGVVFDGGHWTYPAPGGEIVFASGVAPGWSKAGAEGAGGFVDSRFQGRDGKRYGPLPRDWGRWSGLFLHEKQVILSYVLGGGEGFPPVAVLETPGSEEREGVTYFTRTLEIAPADRPLTVRIAMVDAPLLSQGESGDANWRVFGEAPRAQVKEDAKALADAKEGMVAHWTFDEQRDGSIANAAGKGHAMKVADVELVEGIAGKAIRLKEKGSGRIADSAQVKLGGGDFTMAVWVRTQADGTIIAKAPATGAWAPKGRTLFVRDGRVAFDIGWVGAVESKQRIADGKWHHVAVTGDAKSKVHRLIIDGQPDQQATLLQAGDDDAAHILKLGHTSTNFPSGDNRFKGLIDDLRIYDRIVSDRELAALAGTKPKAAVPLVLGCVTEPKANIATWQVASDHAQLVIAAHDKPVLVKVLIARGDAAGQSKAATDALAHIAAPKELTPLTRGGPARWPGKITTEGKRGEPVKGSPWAIDTISWPVENPWRSWMRFGGFDFFRDPSKAAICTWNGDVWLITGIGEDLKQLSWQRIATGLFQPLGLRIVNEQIYVCGRDQITRLHDLNGDGETDYYENFNNDHQVTEHFHEFAMDLQTDAQGNFYYAKSARHASDSLVEQHGTLMKVSSEGRKSEIIANGFRAANGVGIGPKGELFTSDQEGHWMPANRINLLKPDGFYGNMFSYHRGEKPADYNRPILWLPKGFDRSPAEQLVVDSDRWGLPRGSLLSTSYGTGSILHIAYEAVEGDPLVQVQGAAVKLPLLFPTGIMRGRFHPGDGQLYVTGLFGWGGDRSVPGGFWRIRHTGAKVHVPATYAVHAKSITLGFTHPLDEEIATDIGSYLVEAWNYQWTAGYGSAEFKVSDKQRGRDVWKIDRIAISEDRKSITLHVPSLTKAMQVRIKYSLESKEGEPIEHDLHGSIFVVPKSDN